MLKIFASYKRADRPFLDQMLPLLRRAHGKDSVWFDDDIPGGSDWWAVILHHIDVCPVFVFLMSNDALRSDYCLAELREAIRLNKTILLVICRLQTELPKDLDPDLARFLKARQWTTLVNQYGKIEADGMVKLNEDIRDALADVPSDPLPPKTPDPTPEPIVTDAVGRPAWVSWALIGIVALMFVGVLGLLANRAADETPTQTPTDAATTAVAQVEVESQTVSPTDSPTLILTPAETSTLAHTPDYVAAAQTVAAQGTLDFQNARAAETVAAATLYREQTATQTALYEQQTATQAAIWTATATQWTLTPTPNATLTITALIAEWATGTQAADFTATATQWTATPTPTATFTPTHTPTQTLTPTRTPTPTPTPNATQTLEAFARTPMAENAAWTPVERVIDSVTMVYVPTGCFMMGSTRFDDEKPIHEVCITEPFWLDKTEVTQAQFAASGGVKANPNGFTGDNRPVERITWWEAEAYCREKRGGRLPTEAEWEFAARGPDGLVYPWGDAFVGANVVYGDNSGGQTGNVGNDIRVVGASWVGALDMSGNVWEWTSSLYKNYPYDATDGREDLTATGSRVLRGGSWGGSDSNFFRGAIRNYGSPSYSNGLRGFRCARSSLTE
jgi:formylglycine-generating enzyme required for sulfatase activity